MGRPDYRRCKTCGETATEVGGLSHTRQCPTCGAIALAENVVGIHTRSGPAFRRWRTAMAASVGAVLLDDARLEGQTQTQ